MARKEQWQAPSLQLIACLTELAACDARIQARIGSNMQPDPADVEARTGAKMALIEKSSQLVPQGEPAFPIIRQRPAIQVLLQEHGRKPLLKALYLLIRDFCSSVNVVRNMSEDQQLEAAAAMLDEAGNFRLEDYAAMFTLAKRGKLVKILDRVDMQIIGQMISAYDERRANYAARETEDPDRPKTDVRVLPAGARLADPAKVSEFMTSFANSLRWEVVDKPPTAEEEAAREERRKRMVARARIMFENPDFEEIKEPQEPKPR